MEKEYNGIEADSSPPLRKESSQLLDKKKFYIEYYQPDTHILSVVEEINSQVVRGL